MSNELENTEMTPDGLRAYADWLRPAADYNVDTREVVEYADAWQSHIDELASANALGERLKQEAQIHAQEARGLKASLHECYQAAGAQKGNWNGSSPVVDALAAKDAHIAELEKALHDAINRPQGVVPDSALPFYQPRKFY